MSFDALVQELILISIWFALYYVLKCKQSSFAKKLSIICICISLACLLYITLVNLLEITNVLALCPLVA